MRRTKHTEITLVINYVKMKEQKNVYEICNGDNCNSCNFLLFPYSVETVFDIAYDCQKIHQPNFGVQL